MVALEAASIQERNRWGNAVAAKEAPRKGQRGGGIGLALKSA